MRRLPLALVLVAGFGVLPTGASAGPSGPNGPLVFTSGRNNPANNDDNAKIWMVGSFLGGSALQLTTGTTRHSHPAWSPDRTKVAYARSRTGAGARDIYVRDLTTGDELQLTNTVNEDEDRPAWSPDGTEIAYGQAATVGAQRDIFIRPSTGGAPRNLAISSILDEDKPVWSPDGQFIFYARDSVPSTNADIVKELSDNTSLNPIPVVNTNDNEWQPNISPDGTKICYSRGRMADSGADGVDVYTADANGLNSNIQGFATSTTKGEFNCVWAPDGTRIAHVRGVFFGGELVVAPYPGPGVTTVVSDVADHFDGNPDWTYNPPPTCANTSANVAFNSFTTIQLSCADTPDPPSFQQNNPAPEIVTPPSNGLIGGIANDGSVIYTPNKDFQGADSFTYKSNDGTSDSQPATVSITVAGPGQPPRDTRAAVIGRVSVNPKRWRRGTALPRFSLARVGARISFSLDEAARVTLSFQKARPGRRVGGRCVRPTRRNRSRRRCTRWVSAGTLPASQRNAGTTRVRFQGRLSRRKRLGLGRHRVTVAAVDAAGNRSTPRRATFRIVRR